MLRNRTGGYDETEEPLVHGDSETTIDPDRLVAGLPDGLEGLVCGICQEFPLRPVQLPCEHAWCRPCIEKRQLQNVIFLMATG
jgi:hypothetical protein